MKTISHIFLALTLLATAAMGACTGKENTTTPAAPENRMALSAQDTTVTTGLVTNFMDMVVAGDAHAAAAMLHTVDYDDEQHEPYPLTDQQIADLEPMLSTPVTSYEIAGCVFETPDRNEIRCRVTVDGRFTTNWYFKPVRYLGDWYLCVKDSSEGDRPASSTPADIAR